MFSRRTQPARHGVFVIHHHPNTLGCPRLGLAISRKVAGNAVRRNKVRRLIRESFRLRIPQLSAIDFVVTGRPGLDACSPRELDGMLAEAWQSFMDKSHG